mmetsp:Transcript_23405/g.35499  ORF Transcript_23405/g.35499 Transcript_23405/m.35499 type:complete len:132 (-) Transcript_23405:113-508(-)
MKEVLNNISSMVSMQKPKIFTALLLLLLLGTIESSPATGKETTKQQLTRKSAAKEFKYNDFETDKISHLRGRQLPGETTFGGDWTEGELAAMGVGSSVFVLILLCCFLYCCCGCNPRDILLIFCCYEYFCN